MSTNKKIDHESAILQATELFKDKQNTDVDVRIILKANPPYILRYSTQKDIWPEQYSSYGRIALIDPATDFPEIGKNPDGLEKPVGKQEIGVRDFVMTHYPHELVTHVSSGLHVRKEYSSLGIGSLLVALSHQVINDMIIRFLSTNPNMRVYAYITDSAHGNGTDKDRAGWTSYQASKLGYKALAIKGDLYPSFMKRYPVKQILGNSVNS